MPDKIVVTEDVIGRACQRDSRHCMVAEAIQAAKPHWRNISVDLATIRWTNPRTKQRYTAITPDGIRDAIFNFDQGEPVDPFTFHLQPIHRVRSMAGTGKRATKSEQPELFREANNERLRQSRNPVVKTVTGGRVMIEGGKSLPRGHMGGSVTSGRNRPGELEVSEAGNVKLSGGRYRQYGLRQLRS